jgi:hypothetical protein
MVGGPCVLAGPVSPVYHYRSSAVYLYRLVRPQALKPFSPPLPCNIIFASNMCRCSSHVVSRTLCDRVVCRYDIGSPLTRRDNPHAQL